ncbi:hypothetical protein [Actinomadura rubrobrunea]|uniref:hypothetical protein n=1 Tax=Actinomadura rubrobrunea TaxID=115335 RepID=UPI0011B292E1|nr:hypothetical protein [Actinomadura rubrobrunea]
MGAKQKRSAVMFLVQTLVWLQVGLCTAAWVSMLVLAAEIGADATEAKAGEYVVFVLLSALLPFAFSVAGGVLAVLLHKRRPAARWGLIAYEAILLVLSGLWWAHEWGGPGPLSMLVSAAAIAGLLSPAGRTHIRRAAPAGDGESR